MFNIEEKRPRTIIHGALPACHSDKGRTQCRRRPALCGVWGRVVFKPQTAGEGKELPEPNGIMESRVCVTLRWLQLSKIYRALGSTDHEKWKGWWWW